MTNQKNVKNTKIKPTINKMILTTVAAIIIMTKPTTLIKTVTEIVMRIIT